MTSNIITLGGRAFRGLQASTLEHDHWVMSEVRGAGLDRIVMREGESAEEFVRRLLDEVIKCKRLYTLIGGLLIPAGMKDEQWTPEIAEATADHVRVLTNPDDKRAIHNLTVEMLAGFFVNGLAIPMTSRNFSSVRKESGSESGVSAASTTSATGGQSSASLRASRSTGIRKFFAGLFARRSLPTNT